MSTLPLLFQGEAANTNFLVFGLTRPGLEPTIYHTRGDHANHYTTDVVVFNIYLLSNCLWCSLFVVVFFYMYRYLLLFFYMYHYLLLFFTCIVICCCFLHVSTNSDTCKKNQQQIAIHVKTTTNSDTCKKQQQIAIHVLVYHCHIGLDMEMIL
jgi:hypothetical protein